MTRGNFYFHYEFVPHSPASLTNVGCRKKSTYSELNGRTPGDPPKPTSSIREPVDSIPFFWRPQWNDPDVLRKKYIDERLSVQEIAHQFVSSKSTVLKYLKVHGIPVRETGKTIRRRNWVAYGKKWADRRELVHRRETAALKKMTELRAQGFTYESIAEVLNTMGIPTKTGNGKWHRKTIQAILTSQVQTPGPGMFSTEAQG